jgi:hypothetical protein
VLSVLRLWITPLVSSISSYKGLWRLQHSISTYYYTDPTTFSPRSKAVSVSLLAPVVLTMLCVILYVRIYWCFVVFYRMCCFPTYFVIFLLCCSMQNMLLIVCYIMQNMLLIVCYIMQIMLYVCLLASTNSVILMSAVLLLLRFCRSNAALQLTHSVVL